MRVRDKSVEDRLPVHTVQALGSSQHFTPEGYLLCMEVPIARIGIQDYLNEELVTGADDDCEPGSNGIIQVERNEDEVFRPETLASFNGKDVVDDHPEDGVNPTNYKLHTVGTVLHPRRGEGEWSDYMVADLLIKDQAAIEAVRAGKRQVSCGYDADYKSISPGRARQHNITGNHVALVDRGRCGHKCSIGDKEPDMTKKVTMFDRLMAAFKTKDEEAFNAALGEMGASTVKEVADPATGPLAVEGTHIHIHMPGEAEANGKSDGTVDEDPGVAAAAALLEQGKADPNEARLAAVETGIAEIRAILEKLVSPEVAPAADEDEDEDQQGEEEAAGDPPPAKTDDEDPKEDGEGKKPAFMKDSSKLVDAFREAVSGAEILAPGLKMPTFDRAAKPKTTNDAVCLLKRRALAASLRHDDGLEVFQQLTGKKTLDGAMPCAQLDVIFNGAVALTKDRNSLIDTNSRGGKRSAKDTGAKIHGPGDFNKAMREHYGQSAPRR